MPYLLLSLKGLGNVIMLLVFYSLISELESPKDLNESSPVLEEK
jgi:hypothetical protein